MEQIADRLAALGHQPTFVAFSDRSAGWLDHVDHPLLALAPEPPPPSIPHFDAVVVMNDWGVETQGFVRLARIRGAVSIARVEGVQDFDDLDTDRATWPWLRNPYLSADHVLAQGQNDVVALRRRTSVHIVGNPRLESLASEPVVGRIDSRVALINSNFTYGVLTAERRAFLRAAVEASRHAGLRPVISQHPNDGTLPPRFQKFVASATMSDLLREARVLISRFSTVPFEAMALGTPFVYFNPHGERVPTFVDPGNPFPIASSVEELSASLRELPHERSLIREQTAEFFGRQIDIGSMSAVDRTANAIIRLSLRSE